MERQHTNRLTRHPEAVALQFRADCFLPLMVLRTLLNSSFTPQLRPSTHTHTHTLSVLLGDDSEACLSENRSRCKHRLARVRSRIFSLYCFSCPASSRQLKDPPYFPGKQMFSKPYCYFIFNLMIYLSPKWLLLTQWSVIC